MVLKSISRFLRTPFFLLVVVEAVLLYFAIPIAAKVFGFFGVFAADVESIGVASRVVFAATMLIGLFSVGLYQLHQRNRFHESVARIGVALCGAVLALLVFFAVWPAIAIPLPVIFFAIVISIVAVVIARFVSLRFIDESVFRRRVLIFGAGTRSSAIFDLRRRADRRGFSVVGQVRAPGDTIVEELKVLERNGESLLELAKELRADEIVVAMDDRRGNLPIRQLLDCKLRGIEVVDVVEFLERESGKIRVDLVNPGWLILSPGFRAGRMRTFAKRAVDLLVSGFAFLVAWPFMLLLAIAIKIEDGFSSPVFYRQERVGLHGKSFELLKFRSMVINAEAERGAQFAEVNDSRVTRVGKVSRKYRLDELPQLLNVLRGQMSLVGPRPERTEFVADLTKKIPYYAERHSLKPGITGWAQMNYPYGSTDQDAHEKLQYDLYYVKNHSTLLDLVIMLQTVEVVLWGRGAR
ncbi:MAG: TIGR03013 family XrtA/PEP-CTERM system glycosyltransferase [Pseudomonadota bacterium]